MKAAKGVLDRTAAGDLWRNTLSQIPTVFGRMVYLTSLRDSNSGKYEHHGLSLIFGDKQAEQALRSSHQKAFQEWLGFNLEQQKADLDLYLSSVMPDKRTIISNWTQTMPYRNLIPVGSREAERMLFLADLECLLALLRNEHAVVVLDPDA